MHTLGTYGIFLPMIKDAYRHLTKLEVIAFKRFSSSGDQEAAIMRVVEWCRLPCRGRLLGRSAGGGGIAQIVIAGNTEDPEAMCICEVVREMVQVRMQVVVEVVHSTLESAMHLQSADYLLVVFTKGLLRCEAFAQVLLAFREAPNRGDEPVDIVTLLADTA